VICLGFALDDRHFVIELITVGDRRRVGCGVARQEPDDTNRTQQAHHAGRTSRVHAPDAYFFFFFAAGFFFAVVFFAVFFAFIVLSFQSSHPNRVRAMSM
jgi:hypothetical protein